MACLLSASLLLPLSRIDAVRCLDRAMRHCELLACCCAALANGSAFCHCTRCASRITGSSSVLRSATAAAMFWLARANWRSPSLVITFWSSMFREWVRAPACHLPLKLAVYRLLHQRELASDIVQLASLLLQPVQLCGIRRRRWVRLCGLDVRLPSCQWYSRCRAIRDHDGRDLDHMAFL